MNKWCGPPHEQPFLCGAHARSANRPCRQLAMANGRCYLHGGKSTGAKQPKIKHGLCTKKNLEEIKIINKILLNAKTMINKTL